MDLFDKKGAFHDIGAFLFSALFVITLSSQKYMLEHVHLINKIVVVFFTTTQLFLLIYTQQLSTFGPINGWYGDVRFVGWTNNPNQLALYTTVFLLITLYYFIHSQKISRKVVYLLILLGLGWIGIKTESDALQLSWFIGLCLLLILLWIKVVSAPIKVFWKGLWFKILIPLAAVHTVITFRSPISDKITETLLKIYEEGDQGATRFNLWLKGIKALESSPMFGLGPGRHSGETLFRKEEAHNMYIDITTNVGILGISIFLSLPPL